MSITFTQLVDAVARVHLRPVGNDLQVPAKPSPFVPPRLRSERRQTELRVEAVFLAAPAAVGKSTAAKALSAETNAPLLDLATVPVGAGSLRGLLTAAYGPAAIDTFLRGDLPVVIDAIDEGRLHSGPLGLPAFFRTTAELISDPSASRDRIKLVILGRPDALRLARHHLEPACPSLTTTDLEVDFFDEQGAHRMVEVYADYCAEEGAPYWQHRERALKVRSDYFSAIARALGATQEELWTKTDARAFAGYAPVLAALGAALARFEHFERVAIRLQGTTGTGEAWSVLEEVLDEVLVREREKLLRAVQRRTSSTIPTVAYDRDEQLRLLAACLNGDQPAPKMLRLPPDEEQIYQEIVQQRLQEHAFLRDGRPANVVFASFILADTVHSGSAIGDRAASVLREVSREPFIWRSLARRLGEDSLLDGAYIGCVLNSLWNEPTPMDVRTTVVQSDPGSATVILKLAPARTLGFNLTLPLVFFEQARALTVELNEDATVELHGRAGTNGGSAWFALQGPVLLRCGTLAVHADVVQLGGSVWLEAASAEHTSGALTLIPATEMQIGLGGALGRSYPWSRLRQTLKSPVEEPYHDHFEQLVRLCDERIGTIPVHLYADYSIPHGPLNWLQKRFGETFPKLVERMVSAGIAYKGEKEGVKGAQPMIVVRFGTTFTDILAALDGNEVRPEIQRFVEQVRPELA